MSTIQFGLDLRTVNGGRDQFFVIVGPTTPVPEASALGMLGLGLIGLAVAIRKKA